MKNLKVINHPLANHYMSVLREKSTDKVNFRFALNKISFMLATEVLSHTQTEEKIVTTPFRKIKGEKIKETVILVPILRAGLGLVHGFLELYPEAIVSHIGIYRNEETLQPVNYYYNFPKVLAANKVNKKNLLVAVLEPMIATGGSAIHAIQNIIDSGATNIMVASIISAPEGIKAINNRFANHPKAEVKVLTCALDEKLNEHGYIVPGLGDAGDRLFGT